MRFVYLKWLTLILFAVSDPVFAHASTCDLHSLVGLSPQATVEWLRSTAKNCDTRSYFELTADSSRIFTEANLRTIVPAAYSAASSYYGTDSDSLDEFFQFLRAAYYLKYYYPTDIQFDPALFEEDMVRVFSTYFEQALAFQESDEAGTILADALVLVDAAQLNSRFLEVFRKVFNVFDARPERLKSSAQRTVIYSAFVAIERSAVNEEKSLLSLIDPDFMNIIEKFGANVELDSSLVFVPNHAAYLLAKLFWAASNSSVQLGYSKDLALSGLTHILRAQTYLSEPYLEALGGLTQEEDCVKLADQQSICKSRAVADLKKRLFPFSYSLREGKIQVETSLSKGEVESLEKSIQAVDRAFFKIIPFSQPVPDDPNPALKAYLYGSRSEFEKYHRFIFGLDTNNGGIYIEKLGTFFSYQRTADESTYTLDELFRHEYTHYLIGRYVTPGLWGETPLYEHDRMVWIDEGLAEFFVGSTDSGDIAPRESLVRLVQQDGSARMHVSEILQSHYGDFKFYRYAGNLFGFIYSKDKSVLSELFSMIRSNQIEKLDRFIQQLENDTEFDAAFQDYLSRLVKLKDSTATPASSPTPTVM